MGVERSKGGAGSEIRREARGIRCLRESMKLGANNQYLQQGSLPCRLPQPRVPLVLEQKLQDCYRRRRWRRMVTRCRISLLEYVQ
jgi:hypothetical protein